MGKFPARTMNPKQAPFYDQALNLFQDTASGTHFQSNS